MTAGSWAAAAAERQVAPPLFPPVYVKEERMKNMIVKAIVGAALASMLAVAATGRASPPDPLHVAAA